MGCAAGGGEAGRTGWAGRDEGRSSVNRDTVLMAEEAIAYDCYDTGMTLKTRGRLDKVDGRSCFAAITSSYGICSFDYTYVSFYQYASVFCTILSKLHFYMQSWAHRMQLQPDLERQIESVHPIPYCIYHHATLRFRNIPTPQRRTTSQSDPPAPIPSRCPSPQS